MLRSLSSQAGAVQRATAEAHTQVQHKHVLYIQLLKEEHATAVRTLQTQHARAVRELTWRHQHDLEQLAQTAPPPPPPPPPLTPAPPVAPEPPAAPPSLLLSPLVLKPTPVVGTATSNTHHLHPVSASECAHCHAPRSAQFKWCARCRRVGYCHSACQRADWAAHRFVCVAHEPTTTANTGADQGQGHTGLTNTPASALAAAAATPGLVVASPAPSVIAHALAPAPASASASMGPWRPVATPLSPPLSLPVARPTIELFKAPPPTVAAAASNSSPTYSAYSSGGGGGTRSLTPSGILGNGNHGTAASLVVLAARPRTPSSPFAPTSSRSGAVVTLQPDAAGAAAGASATSGPALPSPLLPIAAQGAGACEALHALIEDAHRLHEGPTVLAALYMRLAQAAETVVSPPDLVTAQHAWQAALQLWSRVPAPVPPRTVYHLLFVRHHLAHTRLTDPRSPAAAGSPHAGSALDAMLALLPELSAAVVAASDGGWPRIDYLDMLQV